MKLLIAAGGTGGHIFPGIAVAEFFVAKGRDMQAVFVGTHDGMEGRIIPQYGFRLLFVKARQFLGRNVLYKLATLFGLMQGILTCMRIIREEKPDAILGMGGYTSVPAVFAGVLTGKPTFLHEQNIEPGLANKMLSRFAKKTFISFEDTKKHLGGSNTLHTGNPVRRTLKTEKKRKRTEDAFSIFVFGGSRGARSVNESVLTLLPLLESHKNVFIYHQTGAEDFERIKNAYGNTSVKHEVFPFTDRMGDYYELSDVVISRAGASTIFELAYFKKAAILIPYPFSAGQHQWKNASYVESIGGGYVIGNNDASGERLYEVIKHLMKERALLKKMGENIGKMYVEDSEDRIIKGIFDGIP